MLVRQAVGAQRAADTLPSTLRSTAAVRVPAVELRRLRPRWRHRFCTAKATATSTTHAAAPPPMSAPPIVHEPTTLFGRPESRTTASAPRRARARAHTAAVAHGARLALVVLGARPRRPRGRARSGSYRRNHRSPDRGRRRLLCCPGRHRRSSRRASTRRPGPLWANTSTHSLAQTHSSSAVTSATVGAPSSAGGGGGGVGSGGGGGSSSTGATS